MIVESKGEVVEVPVADKVGKVLGIYLTLERHGVATRVDSAKAVPGVGLEGDVHFKPSLLSTAGAKRYIHGDQRQITLMTVADLAAANAELSLPFIPFSPEIMRRNLVIDWNIALYGLVGRRIAIGDSVVLHGGEPCVPCSKPMDLARKNGHGYLAGTLPTPIMGVDRKTGQLRKMTSLVDFHYNEFMDAFALRGGLAAFIVSGGIIGEGDTIRLID